MHYTPCPQLVPAHRAPVSSLPAGWCCPASPIMLAWQPLPQPFKRPPPWPCLPPFPSNLVPAHPSQSLLTRPCPCTPVPVPAHLSWSLYAHLCPCTPIPVPTHLSLHTCPSPCTPISVPVCPSRSLHASPGSGKLFAPSPQWRLTPCSGWWCECLAPTLDSGRCSGSVALTVSQLPKVFSPRLSCGVGV